MNVTYLLVGCFLLSPVAAEDLNQAFTAVTGLQSDQQFDAAKSIESAVVSAPDAEAKRVLEDQLIRALSKAETREASIFLCRQLRTIGTSRSIGALERRLLDPEIGHAARLALASNGSAEALAALRRALTKASGNHELSLMQDLAKASDQLSRPLFVARLQSDRPAVLEAAARALGHLAGNDSIITLQAKRFEANAKLKTTIDTALLRCAESAVTQRDLSSAQALYKTFFADEQQPRHMRLAGLRGLVMAQAPDASRTLAKALQSPDTEFRRTAIQLVSTMPGANTADTLIGLLEKSVPQDRPLILSMLKDHPKASTAKAVLEVLENSQDLEVQREALVTLGHVGDDDDLPLILKHLASATPSLRDAARSSLVRLSGDTVDEVLRRSVGGMPHAVQEQLIPILAARGSLQAIPALVPLARHEDANIRKAAISALGSLVDGPELHHLLDLLQSPAAPKDKSLVESAILKAFREIPSNQARAKPLLKALENADDSSKPQLIKLLGNTGTKEALKVVRQSLTSANATIQNAAVHTLARWPNAEPAEDLLTLARIADTESHRVVALRGYVTMARSLDDPTAAFGKAMAIAKRPDDQKLVLSGVGQARSVAALGLAASYLNHSDLAEEAALACIKISRHLRREAPDKVRTVLSKIASSVSDEAIQKSAKEALARLDG